MRRKIDIEMDVSIHRGLYRLGRYVYNRSLQKLPFPSAGSPLLRHREAGVGTSKAKKHEKGWPFAYINTIRRKVAFHYSDMNVIRTMYLLSSPTNRRQRHGMACSKPFNITSKSNIHSTVQYNRQRLF